ncbi:LysR family transcriptional regulator [Pseudodonghicola flavimaris]|uniref:LysR family transcriptional regulator n=1 Tax=Pseudodonghicola flavimaris TaxID=3050036 RepID=A0ABT7F0V4_9RHOB|nr:LysR family transcriptional regulator [Pseudodonghicola flavimaris]MDK3018228.1 LysR family transcriptional regulator [Pseudodonghicola flavimaris]
MIDKLEMLLALAKEKHFGRAAETLGITQPTLSAGIRRLEEQLGVRLVQRGSRYGGLTPEGQRALDWARRIVGDSRRLRDEMRASHAGLSGHLRIAVIPTALTWAARLTAGYSERHPNVSFTVLSRSSGEILQMLDNLDVDAGITYLDNEPLGRMESRELYREDYALVCPRHHPMAQRDTIAWAELSGQRLCLLTPDMQNRRIINRNLMEAGVTPEVRVESNSTIVMVNTVLNGPFATILPEDMARFTAAGHDLALIPIERRGSRPAVGMIAPQQDPATPVLQALLKLAEALRRHD